MKFNGKIDDLLLLFNLLMNLYGKNATVKEIIEREEREQERMKRLCITKY